MQITTVGLDIAKHVFHFYGVNKSGLLVKKKQLKRAQVFKFMAQLPPCLIALEACAGAHYWARELMKRGHQVKLIAPQYVKPYVRGNKTDYNDAQAICEAAQRPNMRFVPIKSIEQQDIQALHRVRERTVKERTALVNQIRGLLAEYGIIIPQGVASVRGRLPEILEDADNGLSDLVRSVFAERLDQLRSLDQMLKDYERKIAEQNKQRDRAKRLQSIPGIGPITASALFAAAGNGQDFANGRHFSAWLGLVPKQHSSGGKPTLQGISKRGNAYLRTLLIHGARAVIRCATTKTDKLSRWIQALVERRGHNRACVALANKLARMAWVIIRTDQCYRSAA